MELGMHQPVEAEEQNLEGILKQYLSIKEKGVSCSVKEARPYYNKMCKLEQQQYVNLMAASLMNFSQNIPITKLNEKAIGYVLDDLDFMQEIAGMYQFFLGITWGLYHRPKEYVAWRGELLGEPAYYVELKPKQIEESMYS